MTCATEAMEASASPRKPRVAMCSRSSALRSLLVAWRSKASTASAAGIPAPLSTTRTSRRPPSRTSTRISSAPASRLFSTSSLTAEAGRSTTSPAAMRLATSGGRTRMDMVRLYHKQGRLVDWWIGLAAGRRVSIRRPTQPTDSQHGGVAGLPNGISSGTIVVTQCGINSAAPNALGGQITIMQCCRPMMTTRLITADQDLHTLRSYLPRPAGGRTMRRA